jgi:hypothetical protein
MQMASPHNVLLWGYAQHLWDYYAVGLSMIVFHAFTHINGYIGTKIIDIRGSVQQKPAPHHGVIMGSSDLFGPCAQPGRYETPCKIELHPSRSLRSPEKPVSISGPGIIISFFVFAGGENLNA